MDRIALSKRLEGLSTVFAGNTPYRMELLAMSTALSQMEDEKFASIVDAGYSEDAAYTQNLPGPGAVHTPLTSDPKSTNPVTEQGMQAMAKKLEEMAGKPGLGQQIMNFITSKKTPVTTSPGVHTMSAEASDETVGGYWNREASEAVMNNLLKDICGIDKAACDDTKRHLETEQIPDGTHAGLPEKPSTLKPEQVPSIAESLDSGMVAKSHKTPKEAAELDAGKKGVNPFAEKKDEDAPAKKDDKKVPAKKKAPATDAEKANVERAEQESEKHEQEALEHSQKATQALSKAEKAEAKAEKAEKKVEKEPTTDATSFDFEGIELNAGMEDVELTADDAAKLSQLF